MTVTRDYIVRMPRDTSVVAACHDVGCEAWRSGWDTLVDERTPLGQAQAAYIRQSSGRTFTEMRTSEALTVFRFASGQRCFAEHRTRPARWLVRSGGGIREGGGVREHAGMRGWIDDLDEHVGQLEDQLRKG